MKDKLKKYPRTYSKMTWDQEKFHRETVEEKGIFKEVIEDHLCYYEFFFLPAITFYMFALLITGVADDML